MPERQGHPARRAIERLVQAISGLTQADVQEFTSMSRGAVRHHLRVLVKAGVLQQVERGRSRHYFPASTSETSARCVAVLRQGRCSDVLRQIVMDPGIPQWELAQRLGMQRKVLGEAIGALGRAGLVEIQRDGRSVTYHPRSEHAGGDALLQIASPMWMGNWPAGGDLLGPDLTLPDRPQP